MNIVVAFDQPISKIGAEAFLMLLREEIDGWGGFRGRRIEGVSMNKIARGARGDWLYLRLAYDGISAGQDEVLEGLDQVVAGWGVGAARVRVVKRD